MPSATARELNAIESENAKNLQSDGFRAYQLEKHRANPLHPFSKVGGEEREGGRNGKREQQGSCEGRKGILCSSFLPSLPPSLQFGTGNLQTLSEIPRAKGIDVRAALFAFHKKVPPSLPPSLPPSIPPSLSSSHAAPFTYIPISLFPSLFFSL
jgi:insulysin